MQACCLLRMQKPCNHDDEDDKDGSFVGWWNGVSRHDTAVALSQLLPCSSSVSDWMIRKQDSPRWPSSHLLRLKLQHPDKTNTRAEQQKHTILSAYQLTSSPKPKECQAKHIPCFALRSKLCTCTRLWNLRERRGMREAAGSSNYDYLDSSLALHNLLLSCRKQSYLLPIPSSYPYSHFHVVGRPEHTHHFKYSLLPASTRKQHKFMELLSTQLYCSIAPCFWLISIRKYWTLQMPDLFDDTHVTWIITNSFLLCRCLARKYRHNNNITTIPDAVIYCAVVTGAKLKIHTCVFVHVRWRSLQTRLLAARQCWAYMPLEQESEKMGEEEKGRGQKQTQSYQSRKHCVAPWMLCGIEERFCARVSASSI